MINKLAKASAALVIGASLLFTTTPSATAASSSCKVTLTKVSLVSNDHVGNEWYTEATAGGKSLEEGESVTVKAGSNGKIKLYAYAQEQDKIPEDGESSKTVSVSSISSSGSTVKLRVTVTENRGRYSGNEAVWEFTYVLKK
ncbi:hypothetical protein L2089_00665 [Paenibacillus hunanensis]|uniref:hypothetical protein n=1 Tax=Paenibacillus hunanensis TaxID=539262 RepID=UPI002027516F|nr:hypothetical protein [Paenibacillus hunanensis]MCL9659182.1 hypothetical protein [Paenibacillus hunanensis]